MSLSRMAYCRVRKVKPDGSVITVAGEDTRPDGAGQPSPAVIQVTAALRVNAALQDPYSVAVDSSGNLFIADTYNDCIRKVTRCPSHYFVRRRVPIGRLFGRWRTGDECATGSSSWRGGRCGGECLYRRHQQQPHPQSFHERHHHYVAGNGSAGTIGPAFTGSWYDPTQSGHGLMLEVLPDNHLLALWFAFNPAGDSASLVRRRGNL